MASLALLSNVTVDVLATFMRGRHRLWLPSGFGALLETSLEPPPEMRAFAPDAVVLAVDSRFPDARKPSPVEVARATASLKDAFPAARIIVPDIEDLADAVGAGDFWDERMWKLAAMPWSLRGMQAIAAEVDRLLDISVSGLRKAVAVDFDGTLWQGTIGEDGLEGIVPDVEFQRGLRELEARGVPLVGLSRNNAADVEPAWDDPRMVLHRTDFAEMRVDWNDKAANLEDIARTMNLGIDAFVFVDDNPAERARMAARLPQVAVAPFPVTARRLARLFFPFAGGTDEDRTRAGMYRADAERRRFAAGRSLDDYLKELEIWADVHPVRKSEYARVAQLSQRSNQFNVCTNRYTEADIASFAADPGRLIMVAHAGDRFGDQGLVAFVQAHEGEMVDWVMSCRAMNRGLEFAIEAVVEEELAKRGVSRLSASWRRTPKNAPSADLFDRLGFSVEERGEDAARYSLPLPRPPENKMPRHFVLGTHEGRICQ